LISPVLEKRLIFREEKIRAKPLIRQTITRAARNPRTANADHPSCSFHTRGKSKNGKTERVIAEVSRMPRAIPHPIIPSTFLRSSARSFVSWLVSNISSMLQYPRATETAVTTTRETMSSPKIEPAMINPA
jgi:hypothetical protein